MLNRVSDNKQCDESCQRGGHRGAVQLGVPPGSRPNSIGLRDAVHRLIAVSGACDGPEIEFCDDLAGGELRQPIHSLQPTLLAAGGFPAAMAYLIEEIQTARSPGKEFCQRAIDADQIPSEWKQAVVGITQESLANACRHSKSKRLFLELTLDGDTLCIHARDWGVGFKPKGTATGRFGLGGTCRRLKLLGGTATIDSEPGKGTYVNAEIPLFRRGEADRRGQVKLSPRTRFGEG